MRPLLLLSVALAVAAASPALAQDRVEQVYYQNPVDGTPLTATLHLPAGTGPFPAVIVLSLAGADELARRMEGLGWAVMIPERRGMGGAPELQLRATFRDLADDVAAARAHLRSRPEVDGATVGLLAHGGETMVGMIAALESPPPAFVVLVSARGIPGDELFRVQQRQSAESRGLDAEEVEALDRLVEQLSGIVRASHLSGLGAYRIRALLGGASVRPYRSSSFPADLEGQVRFFSSPWWRDFFTFAPDSVLARLRSPVLVVEGRDDPPVSLEDNLPPIRRSLEAAPTDDVTLCVVPGRVEHAFPSRALDALEEWLRARAGAEGGPDGSWLGPRPGSGLPRACLEDPEAG